MKQGFGNFPRTKIHVSGLCYVTVRDGWGEEKGGREAGVAEGPPQMAGPPASWSLMSDAFSLPKYCYGFPRGKFTREWLNIKYSGLYSGLFSKIMVGILLTCIQESLLAMSRALRVAWDNTLKTSGVLAGPWLFLFCLLNGKPIQRDWCFLLRFRKPDSDPSSGFLADLP